MELVFLLVSFFSSVLGSLCGIGGGVIIKPVLDATGVMAVSSISFLSGCTVLSMAIISVFKQMKQGEKNIDLATGTPLAIGAAIGGILGKSLFQMIYLVCPDENKVGAIQAAILTVITIGTLIYTLQQSKIKTKQMQNKICCIIIGLGLGVMSSFLGIGGGPINLIVLSYFFSMETKKAAANSLYIILFSQGASFISTIVTGSIPEFTASVLALMVFGGVAGGMAGSKINTKISSKGVRKLFCILMVAIIGINVFNVIKFTV